MQTRLTAYWDRVRGSFWFLPLLMMAAALAAGMAMPSLDDWVEIERREGFQWLATTGPAARATLGSLVGALITVSSVVFSVAMVTLSLTTSQFGSRLLRNFFNHNVAQFTMGLFLASSLYCLLILKSVRTVDGEEFVPHLSLTLAVVLALTSCAVFIYFIHHVAFLVQAQNVVAEAAAELDAAVERLYDDHESAAEDPPLPQPPADGWSVLNAEIEGRLQGMDTGALVQLGQERDLLLRILFKPGDFVVRGQPLAEVRAEAGKSPDIDKLQTHVNRAFLTGPDRTPRQDVECPILNLVEVAVRALSPGINDPRTAIACINRLTASLCRLAARRPPRLVYCDDDGKPRLLVRLATFDDALDTAFRQIRQYGADSAAVTIRVLECLAVIASAARREEDLQAIRRQGEMFQRSAERNLEEENDRQDAADRMKELLAVLQSRRAP